MSTEWKYDELNFEKTKNQTRIIWRLSVGTHPDKRLDRVIEF